jgi:hypothetical protein
MTTFFKWVFALALIIGLPWGCGQLFLGGYRLTFVPDAMQVSNLLYASEQSWGFGPGGNETGLLVYEMPAAVAAHLRDSGLSYLEELPANIRDGWQGVYSGWRETPIDLDRRWKATSHEGVKFWNSPGIGDYLNQYGYPIPIEREWEELANRALFAPGSYYAYGRIGLIIVIPDELRIIYAYNG